MMDSRRFCPECLSDSKRERRTIRPPFTGPYICSNNWHWSDAPQESSLSEEDLKWLHEMDEAFAKPIQEFPLNGK